MREERRVKRMARALPLPPRLKNNKKNMKIYEERRKPTKSAEEENGVTAFTLHKNTFKRLSSESWKIMKMMKNHEKSKTKHAEVAQSVSNKKTSQARKRGLCLRNRRKSKKIKKTKKSFFFFACFFGSRPPNPSNNQLQKYFSLCSAQGLVFLQLIVWRVGWAVPGPPQSYSDC